MTAAQPAMRPRGRPSHWAAVASWLLPGYQVRAEDGAIRDQHRHIINPVRHLGRPHISARRAGRRVLLPVADVVADTLLGRRPFETCDVCGRRIPHRVIQLDGDPTNTARSNLEYRPNVSRLAAHQWRCIERLMSEYSAPQSDDREHPNAGAWLRGRGQLGWLCAVEEYLASPCEI